MRRTEEARGGKRPSLHGRLRLAQLHSAERARERNAERAHERARPKGHASAPRRETQTHTTQASEDTQESKPREHMSDVDAKTVNTHGRTPVHPATQSAKEGAHQGTGRPRHRRDQGRREQGTRRARHRPRHRQIRHGQSNTDRPRHRQTKAQATQTDQGIARSRHRQSNTDRPRHRQPKAPTDEEEVGVELGRELLQFDHIATDVLANRSMRAATRL